MGGPDYILDMGGGAGESSRAAPGPVRGGGGRPWLAVHWRCCQVYIRVYRNRTGTMYEGRCPRCGRRLSVPIGPGGTTCRFFEAQ